MTQTTSQQTRGSSVLTPTWVLVQAAGYITAEEASGLTSLGSLTSATDRQLTNEIIRRLEEGKAGPVLTEPISLDDRRPSPPAIPEIPLDVAAYDEEHPSGYDVQVDQQDRDAEQGDE